MCKHWGLHISTDTDRLEVVLVAIERSFQGLFIAIETVGIIEELVEIQPNEVCDNDYLDSFQTLVSDAGYMDPQTLVVKFWCGLRLGIQNQIATMPYGRLADTDPNTWYRAAWRIDQVHLANEAFQSVLCSAPSTLPKTASTHPPPLSMARLPPVPSLLVTPKPPLPTLSMGVPMDVDATRKARFLPLWGCYRCGDVNHLVQDCSHCMDVRQLTAEQWELIENLLALKDVVLIEESCPLEEKEDFV